MKKLFTILLMFALIVGINAQTKKVKVLYVTKVKTMDASAGPDTLLGILKVDARLSVTVWTNVNSLPLIDTFDVVVLSEAVGSGDPAAIQLKGVNKPFLNMKIYAYKNTTWNFGVPADPNGNAPNNAAKYLVVKQGKENHPLLNGVTLTNGKVQIFKRLAADDGGTSKYKGLNYAYGLISTPSSLVDIGKPDTTISGQDDMTCLHIINDQNAVWNQVAISKPYICIGYNYGAICADGANNLTEAGYKIFRNAVEILIAPFLTNVKENSLPQVNAYGAKGEIRIFVDKPSVVSIYSYDGRLIQKSIIQKEAFIPTKAGIYMVNVAGVGTKKVVVTE